MKEEESDKPSEFESVLAMSIGSSLTMFMYAGLKFGDWEAAVTVGLGSALCWAIATFIVQPSGRS